MAASQPFAQSHLFYPKIDAFKPSLMASRIGFVLMLYAILLPTKRWAFKPVMDAVVEAN